MSRIDATSIGSCRTITNFDAVSRDLVNDAGTLGRRAKQATRGAERALDAAEVDAARAALHLVGATVNLGAAAEKLVKGSVVDVMGRGMGHGALSVAAQAGGIAAKGGEETLGFAATVCHRVGEAMVALANRLHAVIGDGRMTTVREIEGHPQQLLSTEMFRMAAREREKSAAGFRAAIASYRQAVLDTLGAGVNVAYVAGYAARATADLGHALVRTGEVQALALERRLTLLAAVAVQAAEQGLEGAASLLELNSRMFAAAGNVLAEPVGGDKLRVHTTELLGACDASVRDLLKKDPRIASLPSVREYLQLAPEMR